MEAWLITWEGMSESAARKDRVVHIVSAKKTPQELTEIVETLYSQFNSTVAELAHYVADPAANPYRAQTSQTSEGYYRVSCGHHPWLEARLVKDLTVKPGNDPYREVVSWKEKLASGEWKQMQVTNVKDSDR